VFSWLAARRHTSIARFLCFDGRFQILLELRKVVEVSAAVDSLLIHYMFSSRRRRKLASLCEVMFHSRCLTYADVSRDRNTIYRCKCTIFVRSLQESQRTSVCSVTQSFTGYWIFLCN
jgi:hypothetical protein